MPPARKKSASPNLIIRQDSPIAWLEVAQAVTMHMFGPCRPNSIEIRPLAMLLISIGMVKGETRDGPLVEQDACADPPALQSADPAAHDHAEALAVHLLQIDAAVRHRHFRRRHGELGKTIGPPGVLGILEIIFRIEVAHLAARSCNRSWWSRRP